MLWAILVVVFLAIWEILNGQSGSSGRDAAAGGAIAQGANGAWLTVMLPVTFVVVLFVLFRLSSFLRAFAANGGDAGAASPSARDLAAAALAEAQPAELTWLGAEWPEMRTFLEAGGARRS